MLGGHFSFHLLSFTNCELFCLVLEESRNSKRGKYVFKLAKTVELNSGSQDSPDTPLLKHSSDGDVRHFILEQQTRMGHTDQLPTEISEMLNDYLSLEKNNSTLTNKPPHRKASRKHSTSLNQKLPLVDYVYDIYYREMVPEDEFVFDEATVGYIKIIEDNGDLIPEEDEDADSQRLSDDEDSNEETYYQNDYPEDEDDDRSVLFSSEEGELNVNRGSVDEDESSSILQTPGSLENDMFAETELDPLFERYAETVNMLDSMEGTESNDNEYEEDAWNDTQDLSENEDSAARFKRHNFFPNDSDDPLALHRDKIFNQLQEMIDRS